MTKLLAALLAAAFASATAFAQPAPAQQPPSAPERARPTESREGRRLPPDVTTGHALDLPGRTLRFKATAGSLPLVDGAGAVQAEIGFTAYVLDGAEAATRPVTFAVNGGPGAASAFLHLLAAGPWRLPLDGSSISPSARPALVPNAETWLDFTDLVFLDPVETGYSRANGSREEIRDRYFTLDGDVSSLSAAIARWLRLNDRLGGPKFFMGESYGGFRGPPIAQKLAAENGVGLSGLILVSPALDFALLSEGRHGVMEHVARLPSFAAAAAERAGRTASRAVLAEAERYASTDYLLDLVRGPRDAQALDRVTRRVAELTGLDEALVRRRAGRIDLGTAARELRRADGRTVSLYDPAITAFDPDPTAPSGSGEDAQLAAMKAPLTSAIVDHLATRLGWRVPNARYELLSGAVNGGWRYGRGRRAPDAVDELKGALALDGRLRVLVAHGLNDLVTPYFGSELLLRQLPAYGDATRASLVAYPGGHMFYTRDASRAAFRDDGREMIRRALSERAGD